MLDGPLLGEKEVNTLFFLEAEERCYKCASCSAPLKESGTRTSSPFKKQHLLQHPSNLAESVEEQWKALKGSIMTSADEYIRHARKKQPDWLIDATDVLTLLLDNKAKARQRYLQLQSASAKHEF